MLVRGSSSVEYDVRLGTSRSILFENLCYTYHEETVVAEQRGYRVVGLSEKATLKVPLLFAMLICFGPTLPKGKIFRLGVLIDKGIIGQKITRFPALPYGLQPVPIADIASFRKEGVLLKRLKIFLLNNFEVDMLRSVIGSFSTAEEVRQKKEIFFDAVQSEWMQHTICATPDMQSSNTLWQETERTVSSSVVEEALLALM